MVRTMKVDTLEFYCPECGQGYKTKLPRVLFKPAKRAWSRVHWTDDGCTLTTKDEQHGTATN